MGQVYNDLLKKTKEQIQETKPLDAEEYLRRTRQARLLDVREKDEWDEGYIPGATHLPRGFLESRVEEAVPDKETPLVVYCAGGVRSAFAAKTLQEMGYTNVVSLSGGYGGWKNAGLPTVKPQSLTKEQQSRYSRHLLVPEIGEAGQLKLLASKILLIGAGGLGAPAAFYLAGAGIGTLGIIDNDVVEESNLQRQIIHTTDRIGQYKADSAAKAIADLNPEVKVKVYKERLTAEITYWDRRANELKEQELAGKQNAKLNSALARQRLVGVGVPVAHPLASDVVPAGALEFVPWVRVVNLARALEEMAEAGYWRIGLAGDATTEFAQALPAGPVALVFGAEGEGLRHNIAAHCDALARLPIGEVMESLNVSNAAAIALYAVATRAG